MRRKMTHGKRIIFGFMCLASVLLFVVSCGDAKNSETSKPKASAAGTTPHGLVSSGPALRMMKLWDSFPPIHGIALDFEGEFTTPEPFNLRTPAVAEFIPAIVGDCEECGIEVTAVASPKNPSERPEEIPLAIFPAVPFPARDAVVPEGPERYDFLNRRAEVDLSPLQGRSVRLRWRLTGAKAGAKPAPLIRILDFKLRAKVDVSKLPPILFICSDAHRYDHAFGENGARLMPKLNALRERGVLYSHAVSTASWTLPSITSVLTGLYPRFHRTGERVRETTKSEIDKLDFERGQFAMGRGNLFYLFNAYPDRPLTIGEALSERGYTTSMVVSNSFYVISGLFADGQDWTVEAKVAPGDKVNAAAIALMRRLPKNRPLFLLVHYLDVHEFMESRFIVEHPGEDPYLASPESLRGYYASAVQDTDRNLGELLEAWDREIGLERSMVVFYADHGEHLFDPGRAPLDEHYRQSPDAHTALASGLLDHGNSMDEVLLHVPLLVKYPAGTKEAPEDGSAVDAPVSLVDLHPTIFELIGRPHPAGEYDGRSLLRAGNDSESRAIYHDYQLYGPERAAIRKDGRKLVLEEDADAARLYDLRIPVAAHGENDQLADDEAVQSKLVELQGVYKSKGDEATRGLRSNVQIQKGEALDDLKSLGYLK